ncbi:Pao retrotransposon peptidase [Popillia japonica]|uniref:Pao retrotransposon peptidase n=1 Tax=Popillia japonica TaxID=7064 RepID=A0AAW1JW82_POPJA
MLHTIQYSTSISNTEDIVCKRTILSEIAQIFDPLGLLGPAIIVAKLIIQRLWEAKLAWEDSIPQGLLNDWLTFREDLKFLDTIKIPRQVTVPNCSYLELHGFADSNGRAFGACLYIRSKINNDYFRTKLLCANPRVALLEKVTLPRLELCSAVLLAQLVQKVRDTINIKINKQYLWSDSKITLAWIQAAPNLWKTFVANRVSNIQRLTNTSDWNHVGSKYNPADLLSRGTSVYDLERLTLWWSGPNWLLNDDFKVTTADNTYLNTEIPEQRLVVSIAVNDHFDIFNKYSSFRRLQLTIAWCLRFIANCKVNKETRQLKRTLTTSELQISLRLLVKLAQ